MFTESAVNCHTTTYQIDHDYMVKIFSPYSLHNAADYSVKIYQYLTRN